MQLLHTRQTRTDCWLTDDGFYKAIGIIDDDKGISMTTYSGKPVEPGGDLHTMRATLILNKTLIIQSAVIEMIDIPGDECKSACAKPEDLIGLSISRGYNKGLKERIGGIKGCSHVFALLQQMGPAIVQAVYSDATNDKHNSQDNWEPLIDTCFTWRDNGPVVMDRRQQQIK